jgi:hypothetical protein
VSAKHLQGIRLCELERAMPVLAGAGAVLEIGGTALFGSWLNARGRGASRIAADDAAA